VGTGRVAVGHPVDVGSGVQFTAWEDIEVDGHFALVWRRFYSTAFLDMPASIHGKGWRHGFDLLLRRDGNQYLFQGPDGAEVLFDDVDDVEEALNRGRSVIDFAQSMELRREAERFAIYHWHDWESEVHKFIFEFRQDEVLKLDRVELPSGHGVKLSYDTLGRLIEVRQDIENRVLLLEYNAGNNLAKLYLDSPLASKELVCTYEYDMHDRLVAVIDASGVPLVYRYDDQPRLVLEKTRAGGIYHMKYDAKGRCIETTGEQRYGFRRIEYNDAVNITVVTDSLGYKSIYKLNAQGQVETEGLPNGAITTREFDEYGRVTAEVGPMETRTQYKYDDKGNLAETAYPNGAFLKVEYDDEHLPIRISEADGGQWQLHYRGGALMNITDPLGRKTDFIRNAMKIIEEIRTPAGNRIAVSRDAAWTEESYTDEYGLIMTQRLDRRLNIIAVYNANGLRKSFAYDQLGRLIAVIEPDGTQRKLIRDADGQLVQYIDGNGYVTSIEYSPYSDYISITNANGARYRLVTDTEGRVIEFINPKEEKATFKYDAVGNLTRETFFDGRVESFTYDVLSRCIRKQKADGVSLEYTCNTSGQITQVTSDGKVLLSNTYDICDQLIETITPDARVNLTYDLCGRVIAETQGSRNIRYTIGLNGFVEECSFDGSKIRGLQFRYDKRGRLISLGTDDRHNQRYEYDAADLVVRRHIGRATEFFEYDVRERVTKQGLRGRYNNDVLLRTFAYDAEDNLIRESDTLHGDVTYTYGPSGLLLRSQHSRRGTAVYRYDICGNLVEKGEESFQYREGNRLIQRGAVIYDRDANGNRISSSCDGQVTQYIWDPLDQLTGIIHPDGSQTSYGYDGLGRRVCKLRKGLETRYYWAGDNLLSEQTHATVLDYAIGEFYPDAVWENGKIRHVVRSYRGMPCELVDDEGQMVWHGQYDDWGSLVDTANRNATPNLRLPGQFYDSESGMHYNRFRFYDPAVGRFISPDPLGIVGGANGFLYAPNPINWSDPLGLYCGKKGCRNTVYVLKKNGKIVYVGITSRAALTRMQEHARAGKKFDEMRVVATGLTRRQARNIEGSALMNIEAKQVPGAVSPKKMQNAKTQDGGLYHAYDQNTSGPGRVVQTPAQSTSALNQTVIDKNTGNPVVYANP